MSILTLWARDGEAPLALTLPVSVSDVHDDYVQDDDGVWRIRHRHLTTAFLGDEPAVLPSRAPGRRRRRGTVMPYDPNDLRSQLSGTRTDAPTPGRVLRAAVLRVR